MLKFEPKHIFSSAAGHPDNWTISENPTAEMGGTPIKYYDLAHG